MPSAVWAGPAGGGALAPAAGSGGAWESAGTGGSTGGEATAGTTGMGLVGRASGWSRSGGRGAARATISPVQSHTFGGSAVGGFTLEPRTRVIPDGAGRVRRRSVYIMSERRRANHP